jgi:hypothetical protein
MKAKEFIPTSKPRNFVAKNAQSSGAGRHQDSSKKKDMEQGKVKHKKDLIPMEDQDMAEAVVASGPSRPLDDRAVRKMVWDTMKINADTGEQALQRALAVLAKKPQSRMVQDLQDKFQSLSDRLAQGMAEGWSDAMVARRTGGPRTPYSVYIKGKKWKDFENDDHAEAVANKLKAKFKADGRDPSVITIAPTEIFTGEATALEKFRKAADEREKKHDAAEKEMKARHASGKEDMKGSIDRLEKHLNNKDVGEASFRDDEFRNQERNAGLEDERNNIAVYINKKLWKVFAGKGRADSFEERQHLSNMKNWADKKSAATGKKWEVSLTGAEPTA